MKKNIKNSEIIEGSYGPMQIVEDFLPPPEVLARAKVRIILTVKVDNETYNFFKDRAKKLHKPYQEVIQEVLIESMRKTKQKKHTNPAKSNISLQRSVGL